MELVDQIVIVVLDYFAIQVSVEILLVLLIQIVYVMEQQHQLLLPQQHQELQQQVHLSQLFQKQEHHGQQFSVPDLEYLLS
jgi:hypothetical protein